MEIVYKQAFTEVLEVLEHSSRNIVEKIPIKFIEFLKENTDDEYIVDIDFSKPNWEDEVKEETQAILALIYRDYIVSPEKRNELIREEKEEQIRIENEIRDKYNPDKIFKDRKKEKVIEDTNMLVEIRKQTFFKKLISFIKGLFNKSK